MARVFAVVVFALWAGAASAACPGTQAKDKHQFFSARQLMAPKVTEVRAGGTVLLEYCESIPGVGNIPFDPSVSIHYGVDRKQMDLEFRTEGACDTVLLIRGPSGAWHFDDDNGPGRNARLRLGSPPAGRYEIWVGSNGGEACATRLTLQTFRGSVRLAAWEAGRI